MHCGPPAAALQGSHQAPTFRQQLECWFVLRRWFLVQERGLGHWRVYKSQLQTLLKLVHFSHRRNMKIKILEWAEICLGYDLGNKEGKGHHRNSFKPSSHGQSRRACSLAVWNKTQIRKSRRGSFFETENNFQPRKWPPKFSVKFTEAAPDCTGSIPTCTTHRLYDLVRVPGPPHASVSHQQN